MDDLLLCASTAEHCKQETRSLQIFLGEIGCKVSKDKLCIAQPKVIFLGHCISHGTKQTSHGGEKTSNTPIFSPQNN